ncbi:DUF5677 domain-containing protein [Clostridium sp. FP2]|uniref:DUF5677 domain-containing protein n=1 Tax=Clostridium sp. FP2 TaxID=2724481 RepID=UPI0013E96924|nr:DUF5677 domain-containing protein [Clostridium sp. FP2]MBZ9621407.1 DUF5677 domain-containing protein [Clostridium sp. FP2]
MFNIEDLNDFILDKEVYKNVIEKSENELGVSLSLQTFVELELLIKMNEISNAETDEHRVNQAINILFAQAIKSFKSCIILATNGYFPNALINLRNIVEIIFNVKYIVEESNKKLKRANDYLSVEGYWTVDSIKARSCLTLDKPLYKVYTILCGYSHSNYMGTGQNFDGKNISINPSEKKAKPTIEFINSIYYYLIKFICGYFNIKSEYFDNIQFQDNFDKIIEMYDTEKSVIDFVLDIVEDAGWSQQDKADLIREYKEIMIGGKKKKKM